MPADMDPSEAIVGLLDAERAQGIRLGVAALRELSLAIDGLTDEALDAVRAKRAELFAMWDALPEGDTLELPFDRAAQGAPSPSTATRSRA